VGIQIGMNPKLQTHDEFQDMLILKSCEVSALPRQIALRDGLTFGRSSTADVQLSDPNFPNAISRKHAIVQNKDSSSWEIRDMKSLNGVFVNGQQQESCELREGDVICFGGPDSRVAYTFQMTPPNSHTGHGKATSQVILLSRRCWQVGRPPRTSPLWQSLAHSITFMRSMILKKCWEEERLGSSDWRFAARILPILRSRSWTPSGQAPPSCPTSVTRLLSWPTSTTPIASSCTRCTNVATTFIWSWSWP